MPDLSAAQAIAEAELVNLVGDEIEKTRKVAEGQAHHGALVLAALAAAGYAVIRLPEVGGDGFGGTLVEHNGGVMNEGGAVRIRRGNLSITGVYGGTPDYCRGIAGALLAAANAAEATQ